MTDRTATPGSDKESAETQSHGHRDDGAWLGIAGGIWSARGDINAARNRVLKDGSSPEDALLEAVKKNRVVGIGDNHGPLTPQLAFLADEMPKLKEAGVTHLAVEIPTAYQNRIDSWTADDKEFLRNRLKDKSSLINVMEQAKAQGIQVTAIDDMYGNNGQQLAGRDRTMAKNIMGLLADPAHKVAAVLGAEHLQDGFRQDSFGPSTVDILRRKNIAIPTFYPQVSSAFDSLTPVARSLDKPLNIDRAHYGEIGTMPVSTGVPYSKWDNVVLYPPRYKMEAAEAELKQEGKDAASELRKAISENKVVLVGESPATAPEVPENGHRKLMAESMADLKAAGLTDLAVDIAPGYLERLKEGTQAGPLPAPYDSADFKNVLAEATKNGITLHAIGATNESNMTMGQILEHLADETGKVATGAKGKVIVWLSEERTAKYEAAENKSVSLSSMLRDKAVQTTAFAALTQDFADISLGLITEITPSPLSFEPGKTKVLSEIPNNQAIEISRFEHVIVYPSPSQ